MFHIIQSNDPDILVNKLLEFYQNPTSTLSLSDLVFDKFTVIVPSMVLGEWLNKQVASRLGISTLFTAQFWGKYQWDMIKHTLDFDKAYRDGLRVPEVAVLSASIIRWRIFGFLHQEIKDKGITHILENENEPLAFLLTPLYDKQENKFLENRIWQACDELARIYVRYLTHRPKWLLAWAKGESLEQAVQKMMNDKIKMHSEFNTIGSDDIQTINDNNDNQIPDWLWDYYLNLEKLLGYLWYQLFGQTYLYREKLEDRFWQILEEKKDLNLFAQKILPQRLYLFTVQQIPQVELDFLKRLSLSLDVILFHFNPSMLFWADIVDKNWLLTQQIIKPQSVYLKDYGHGLLSRLGKESRETFAMLADMSGGADEKEQAWQVVWHDEFKVCQKDTLLDRLKQDILMLGENQTNAQTALGADLLSVLQYDNFNNLNQKSRPKITLPLDKIDSLSIHACHSLKRQLEIARLMIAKYLNENPKSTLADVVVLLPDVNHNEELIRAVFPEGVGIDGLTLPIKITGTTEKNIDELLTAISGFYTLVGDSSSRFYAEEVYEWLMTPALYESFHLTFDEIKRGCDLLTEAGFKRGFDESHLKKTLAEGDADYRYSFSYALDRMVLGLLAPTNHRSSSALHPFKWEKDAFVEAVLPLQTVTLADQKVINVLTKIHQGLDANRYDYDKFDRIEVILNKIEQNIINRYFARFNQTEAMNAIFATKNSMMSDLRANANYQQYHKDAKIKNKKDNIHLSLQFVLNSLTQTVKAQAIKAEPADVITFARFGALRSIPFGLTVMLDMNLSAFPRQDRAVRLDLMRAGIKKRGDRYNEDDDNGAFLDAILCTKDRVLIFYNGVSADGQTLLLPASPVSELLQFFKTEARWQTPLVEGSLNADDDKITQAFQEVLPSLIESYLVTYHSATAFDYSVFYKDVPENYLKETDDIKQQIKTYLKKKLMELKYYQQSNLPPPQLWQEVRDILDKNEPIGNKNLVNLPDITVVENIQNHLQKTLELAENWVKSEQYQEQFAEHCSNFTNLFNIILDNNVSSRKITNSIKNPAYAYLYDKIHLIKENEEKEPNEPLTLGFLESYQLKELILENIKLTNHEALINYPEEIINSKNKQELENNIFINKLNSIYYDNLLPVGLSRTDILNEKIDGINQEKTEFFNILKSHDIDVDDLITKTNEQSITLNFNQQNVLITENIPSINSDTWINILPKSAKSTHLFSFWICHLIWQIARKTDNQNIKNNQGVSIWHFNKQNQDITDYKNVQIFKIVPIHYKIAQAYLFNMMVIDKILKQIPLIFTIRESVNYCLSDDKSKFIDDKKNFDKWLAKDYQNIIDEQCSMHETWKIMLSNHQNHLSIITRYIQLLKPLFELMVKNLQPIK